nr:acyltransferase [uncultured Rhodopila sp.]
MKEGTSLYLDCVRFVAALTVFASHYGTQHFTGGQFYQLQPYGAEAVDVFFVLSGFVIGCVTDGRERSARVYAVNRAARLWSVALPVLLLTLVLDRAGSALRPDLYTAAAIPHYHPDGWLGRYLLSAVFLNQTWHLDITPGTDWPYWSLGYEPWYYVIFGMAIFAPGRVRVAATVIGATLAGPKVLALFPLWLAGFACSRLSRNLRPSPRSGAVLAAASVAGWIAYEARAVHHGRLFGLGPDVFGRLEFAQDYLIGALFAVHLIGICHLSGPIGRRLGRFARPIRWLAGSTFSLYLMHYPVMQFLNAARPWPRESPVSRVLLFGLTLAAVFLFAEVSERRKPAWRRAIAALSGRLLPPNPVAVPVRSGVAAISGRQ